MAKNPVEAVERAVTVVDELAEREIAAVKARWAGHRAPQEHGESDADYATRINVPPAAEE